MCLRTAKNLTGITTVRAAKPLSNTPWQISPYLVAVTSLDLEDPDGSISVSSVEGASVRAPAQACAVKQLYTDAP
jgi:hypothetical protein